MPPTIFNPRFGLRPFARVELEVNLPGVTPGGVLTTNAWGMRGEEPPEDWDEWLTIITVGGSTTANFYLDDSLTWSRIIQDRLREVHPQTWVGNCGIPIKRAASGIERYLASLPKYFPLVHPSPLNFRWQAKNPWFKTDVLPNLKNEVQKIITN